MKKILAILMIVISVLTMPSTTALAGKLPEDIKVVLDNKEIQSKVKPYEKNDDVMILVRQTSNILGAKVRWDKKNKTVWVDFDMMHIELKQGKRELYIHRDADFTGIPQTVKLNSAIVSVNGKTYVPAQQFLECFGMNVSWNSNKKVLTATRQKIGDVVQKIPFTQITEDDINEIKNIHQWYQNNYKKSGIRYKKYQDTLYVLIGAGKKPTGGFEMGINSITYASTTKANVSAYVKSPDPDMMVIQVETYPHLLIRIDGATKLNRVNGDILIIGSDTMPTEVAYEKISYEDIMENEKVKAWYDEINQIKGIHYFRDGKYMYALISGGERSTGGYLIELDEIYYSNMDTVYISARVNPPSDDVSVIMMITYPSMLIRIESDSVQSAVGEVIDQVTKK